MSNNNTSVTEFGEASGSGSLGGVQSEDLSQLQVIFPFTPVETLEKALHNNYNMDFAINDLLSSADNGENSFASSKASAKDLFLM